MFGKKSAYALGFTALLFASSLYLAFFFSNVNSCGVKVGLARVSRFQLPSTHFDGVTKFRLPEERFPNGIAVASDGSVWFGEQINPGVGHLFENGTMIDFTWPINYSPSTTSIWGVAQWNGRIWATDSAGNQIVNIDPATAIVYALKLSTAGAFPYTITVGPDGALWFTELYGSRLGRIDKQCNLTEYPVPTRFGGTPTQVEFENSTHGYYVDAGNATSGLGEVLSFGTTQFAPQPIDGTFRPQAATSLALVPNGLWVAQHESSNLAYYDFRNQAWYQFPTTPVSYIESTLPYFVAANGSMIWFNEHYANRIGAVDADRGLLTEYSLSNPPANNITEIGNALTFALGKDKVWFTELTASYVGYLDASYQPSFSFQPIANANLRLQRGSNTSIVLRLDGNSGKNLTIVSSDSETPTSRSQWISLNLSETELSNLNGAAMITLNVATNTATIPGNYTLLVSATDGLVSQGIYLRLSVSQ